MFEGNGTIINILFSLIAQSEYGTVFYHSHVLQLEFDF